MTHSTSDSTHSTVRVRYMSDLHMEFTHYKPTQLPTVGEDLIVLAGDIGTGTAGITWAKEAFPSTPVLYIMGNHEFYGYDWSELLADARSTCEGSNVVLLENDAFRFKGVRFLGATLWTNFLLGGPAAHEQAMDVGERFINDYRHIRVGNRALTARESVARHAESAAWLRRELAASAEPTVVITHHGPSLATAHPDFLVDIYSNCFLSNLPDEYFSTPLAWIYGHNHHSRVQAHRNTVLHSNQRGYPDEALEFDWGKTLEVRVPLPRREENGLTGNREPEKRG